MPQPATPAAESKIGAQPAEGQGGSTPVEPNLLLVLGLLWRHKALILSTILLGTLATVLILFQLTPRYDAQAQILIATRPANVVDIENVLEALRPDRTTVQSEAEVLASRSLAEQLVDELGLMEKPEFNQSLRPPSLRNPVEWFAAALRAAQADDGPGASAAPEEAESLIRNDVITALQEAMTFEIVRISRVISVGATSEDPNLAAAIANTLTEIYLREQLRQKSAATQHAASWLDERVQALRGQVEQSQRAVEDYRQQEGLAETSNVTLVEQQISEVNTQLIAARAETAEADARLRQARALMDSEGGIYAAADVLAAPLIQNLRMEEARLAGEAAQMASEYGRRHPKMINVTAELSDIRAKISVEVERIVRSLENSREVAGTRERTLEQSLEDLKAEAARLTASQARLRVLEREAAANQTLFDVFLARWKETGQQEELQSADARIISRATAPSKPSWPNSAAAIGIGFMASVLLALALVFFVEQMFNRGYRHAEQIEDQMNTGTLGLIPMLAEDEEQLVDYVTEKPTSAFAESLRMLHTGLLLSDDGEASATSVLITSSVAEEGKTFIALALARLTAQSGRKVLLIDADLRHGQIGKRLQMDQKLGLAHLLTGRVKSANKAIVRDEKTGLDVLVAGRMRHMPPDLVRSGSMSHLIAEAKTDYELIVIDSPPALLVSDARTLAKIMDKTVFVVRWATTARKIALAGLKQLVESGAQVSGAVLSMVETGKNMRYPYYGPGAYGLYTRYGRYYSR